MRGEEKTKQVSGFLWASESEMVNLQSVGKAKTSERERTTCYDLVTWRGAMVSGKQRTKMA